MQAGKETSFDDIVQEDKRLRSILGEGREAGYLADLEARGFPNMRDALDAAFLDLARSSLQGKDFSAPEMIEEALSEKIMASNKVAQRLGDLRDLGPTQGPLINVEWLARARKAQGIV